MPDSLLLANRYLRARFCPQTGALQELSGPDGAALLTAAACWYDVERMRLYEKEVEAKPGTPSSQGAAGGVFTSRWVKSGRDFVESEIASPLVAVRRRFHLPANSPLLRVEYTVAAAGKQEVRLKTLAFPQVDFSPLLADPFEDERDRYFDGAELGDGRELPAWRVFFRKDSDTSGLLLAGRGLAQMSHVNIRIAGFELRPHDDLCYTTNYDRPELVLKGKATQSCAFEVGPWKKSGHAALLKAARLDQPVKVQRPRAVGKKPRPGKGVIVDIAAAAPAASRARRFAHKRWLEVKLPWARGSALVAGPGVEPPPLKLRPGLSGLYRIFVGVGNGAGVVARLSSEPEPIFRVNPRFARETFQSSLTGKHQANELCVGVEELRPKTTLQLSRFPDLHSFSMLDYVRFEPLSQAEADQWRALRNAPLRIPLSGFNDTPDIAPMTNALKPDPAAYRANLWEHARCGVRRVHWRIDGQCSDFPSKVNSMRYVSARVHGLYYPQGKAYGRALQRFDMLKLAVDAARQYDLELFGWMRFNYYYGNVQSDFFKKNPQYWEEWEHGGRGGKLCLAIPEVRKHKIDILVEAAKYGLDGLCLGFLRHPPMLHFHPILVEGYQAKYGQLPPRLSEGDDLLHRATLAESDPKSLQWYQYRADFLTQLGRELKQALRAAGLAKVKVSIWVRPQHCLFDGIDMPAWLNEGLCDDVVASAQTAVDDKLPIAEPSEQWKRMVQAKVPLSRGTWGFDIEQARSDVQRFLAQGYDGICTYESDIAVLDSQFIELYQSLRVASGAPAPVKTPALAPAGA